MSALTAGDRLLIAGESHPWHGSTGVIAGPFVLAGLDWLIRLKRDDAHDGHECAAAESDLLPARKRVQS